MNQVKSMISFIYKSIRHTLIASAVVFFGHIILGIFHKIHIIFYPNYSVCSYYSKEMDILVVQLRQTKDTNSKDLVSGRNKIDLRLHGFKKINILYFLYLILTLKTFGLLE